MRKRSWSQDENRYRIHIEERLGKFVAADLKRRDIIEARDDIADDVSGVTANRCQAVISAVLKWALDEDLIEISPAHGIRSDDKRFNANAYFPTTRRARCGVRDPATLDIAYR